MKYEPGQRVRIIGADRNRNVEFVGIECFIDQEYQKLFDEQIDG